MSEILSNILHLFGNNIKGTFWGRNEKKKGHLSECCACDKIKGQRNNYLKIAYVFLPIDSLSLKLEPRTILSKKTH